jgi:hypothetical protein
VKDHVKTTVQRHRPYVSAYVAYDPTNILKDLYCR